MSSDELRWIVEACTTHGALLFVWVGKVGHQAVLMPGYTYYWWLEQPEDIEHGTRSASIH